MGQVAKPMALFDAHDLPDVQRRRGAAAHLDIESALRRQGHAVIAGADEAGRGPLAGPVSAAAVILDPGLPIAGLNDSKQLKPAVRDALFDEICAKATFAVAFAPSAEVDRINVLQASLAAMRRAIAALPMCPDYVLIDGNIVPRALPCAARAVIGGDSISASIAAASIIAKVMRDRMMARASEIFCGYGFEKHFGYATPGHHAAISAQGPCALHRMSFSPFKNGTPDLFDQ